MHVRGPRTQYLQGADQDLAAGADFRIVAIAGIGDFARFQECGTVHI